MPVLLDVVDTFFELNNIINCEWKFLDCATITFRERYSGDRCECCNNVLNTFMLPFQRVSSDPYRHCTYTLYGASRSIEGCSGDEKGSTGNEK